MTAAGFAADTANAVELSSGCQFLNRTTLDASYTGSTVTLTFVAGETVQINGNLPKVGSATGIELRVRGLSVDTDGFPGSVTYTIPKGGSYQIVWRATPASHLTWTVACNPRVVDSDSDGVLDTADACPTTSLPDVPTERLIGARFAAQADGGFDSGLDQFDGLYTVADTAGCSGSQIIALAGLGDGHKRYGISKGELEEFIVAHRA